MRHLTRLGLKALAVLNHFMPSYQTKTYDAVTEKFMDFSFEKTHSAYMLFYERCDPSEKDLLSKTPNIELNQELADWIWHDNIQFLHDKHVFDTTYFNFMWLICSNIPPSVPESKEVMLSNVKLGKDTVVSTFFFLWGVVVVGSGGGGGGGLELYANSTQMQVKARLNGFNI